LDELEATVQKIVPTGRHGSYAVAGTNLVKGSITFSLGGGVWQEESWPESGSIVVLSQLVKKEAGWRAMRGRFLKPSDEAKSNQQIERRKEMNSEKITEILQPLAVYQSQLRGEGERKHIGGGFSMGKPDVQYITHADFVRDYVLPCLSEATDKFGIETIAKELVEVSLPGYKKIEDEPLESKQGFAALFLHGFTMASFWNDTVASGVSESYIVPDQEKGGKLNPALIAKFGAKKFLSPIIDLAIVHAETLVFSNISKFFSTHACRMGEVITRFGYDDYLVYIELAKKLLRHGVYDWSIEHSPKEWTLLTPAISKFGFKEVLEPTIDALAATGHIPGTKDPKYQYSYLNDTIRSLFPYLIPKAMSEGIGVLAQTIGPIADFVEELHQQGAFVEDSGQASAEREFFASFEQYTPIIETDGIERLIETTRAYWLANLTE